MACRKARTSTPGRVVSTYLTTSGPALCQPGFFLRRSRALGVSRGFSVKPKTNLEF